MCPLTTQFAPAERANKKKVSEQALSFLHEHHLVQVLDAVTIPVLILNDHRQIVSANKSFLDLIKISDPGLIVGLRLGEAIGCIHAKMHKEGCGTTEFCSECGAIRAILNGIKGNTDIQECRISLEEEPNALDLKIMAVPLKFNNERFIVFSIIDIAHEKRREVLERIFLHDVSNTAGGIHGLIRLMCDATGEKTELYRSLIYDLTDKLIEEIRAHRQLVDAETSRLEVDLTKVNSIDLLKRVKNLFIHHDVAKDKHIIVDQHAEKITFTSDETILSRVLGNMTKNALEAIDQGKRVTLSCKKMDDKVLFSVHNPGVIPRDVQLQIFQRSFSTKGSGRGLGTYSIKLLSEQYLHGTVGFTSSEKEGTLFYAEYPLRLKA
jgi:signal transduction histidine kinase